MTRVWPVGSGPATHAPRPPRKADGAFYWEVVGGHYSVPRLEERPTRATSLFNIRPTFRRATLTMQPFALLTLLIDHYAHPAWAGRADQNNSLAEQW